MAAMDSPADVAVVGAGLAGSEAAWQLARRGLRVALYEMRPQRPTEAHRTPWCAELVCSNSFKSLAPDNAHGLLKRELEIQGSLILELGRAHAVPAGQALAVDRDAFAQAVTARLAAHPGIRLVREEVTALAPLLARHRHVIVATGPLTAAALADDLRARSGAGTLYFHDAIAPVIHGESLDTAVAFKASRYGKGGDDYWNCPFTEAQYLAFVEAVRTADTVPFHDFESLRPFEGCLPIEVMVERGPLTLAFGPMKPVGLFDPRTGRRPFAVVQLRQENRAGTLLGLVGFQTKMTWPEQRRIFRTIPGLEHAEFERLGSLHRNTFLCAPALLDADLALKTEPRLSFAGQLTGVEGYLESTAMGLYAAKRAAARLAGAALPYPSAQTMTGALVRYLLETPPADFQPMNSAFGLLDALPGGESLGRKARKAALAERAAAEMAELESAPTGRTSLAEAAPEAGEPRGRGQG
jgi:methylenetetrahydrofolate--tRNA-(uracil-5-)-methyltransferase